MQIDTHEIHVFAAPLSGPISEERAAVLNADERERANRLISPLHRQYFIAAHVVLREILGHYLEAAPASIQFTFGAHRKPALAAPFEDKLHFNLSHSEDMAVYAITTSGAIGVDIEKIRPDNKIDVADRFFSPAEKSALATLPSAQQIAGFYHVWSRKEAIIKANGKGLAIPLSSFSVSIDNQIETVSVEEKTWTLLSLPIHPDYAAALAAATPPAKISLWDIIDAQPVLRTNQPAS